MVSGEGWHQVETGAQKLRPEFDIKEVKAFQRRNFGKFDTPVGEPNLTRTDSLIVMRFLFNYLWLLPFIDIVEKTKINLLLHIKLSIP